MRKKDQIDTRLSHRNDLLFIPIYSFFFFFNKHFLLDSSYK